MSDVQVLVPHVCGVCAVIVDVFRTVLVDELQGLFDFLQPASGDHHPLHTCFPGSPEHLCHGNHTSE